MTLHSIISNAEDTLALEPEELAGPVLAVINANSNAASNAVNPQNVEGWIAADYPREYETPVRQAFWEAWTWLVREGMVAPKPSAGGGWYFVTRRGQRMKVAGDLDAYRKASLLPRQLLHPVVSQKVYGAFLRGDYDTAVFQTFREVEIAVRDAGKFGPNDLGVDLMRKAFHPQTGPLTDQTAPAAERQALSDLFAGAIGLYKNPASHRLVGIGDPVLAIEMVVLGSHLLRTVDDRRRP